MRWGMRGSFVSELSPDSSDWFVGLTRLGGQWMPAINHCSQVDERRAALSCGWEGG